MHHYNRLKIPVCHISLFNCTRGTTTMHLKQQKNVLTLWNSNNKKRPYLVELIEKVLQFKVVS